MDNESCSLIMVVAVLSEMAVRDNECRDCSDNAVIVVITARQ